MATRAAYLDQRHIEALNQIDAIFDGYDIVPEFHEIDTLALHAKVEKASKEQVLAAMKELGIDPQ